MCSSDLLRGKVTVEVASPGIAKRTTVRMPLTSPWRATSLVAIPAKAKKGVAHVVVTGTDARGGRQVERITLRLR